MCNNMIIYGKIGSFLLYEYAIYCSKPAFIFLKTLKYALICLKLAKKEHVHSMSEYDHYTKYDKITNHIHTQ